MADARASKTSNFGGKPEAPATAWRRARFAQLREDAAQTSITAVDDLQDSLARLTLAEGQVESFAAKSPEAKVESRVTNPSGALSEAEESLLVEKRSAHLDDLAHLQLAFIQAMLAFSTSGHTIRFLNHPPPHCNYERADVDSEVSLNSGTFALDFKDRQNRAFLEYQEWLAESVYVLKEMRAGLDPDVEEYREGLERQIRGELESLEDIKEMEWEVRDTAHTAEVNGASGHTIDTGRHFFAQLSTWSPAQAPIKAFSIVSATSTLLLGMSRKATAVLMGGLRSSIQLALEYARSPNPLQPQDHRLLRRLARDPRTVLSAFDLDPCVTAYNCCPSCFALYELAGEVPQQCTYRSTPSSDACGEDLWIKRTIRGKSTSIAVRKYLHQSMKHWLGRMLTREDVETWLQLPRHGDAPDRMTDMFHGIALTNFLGHDGRPFLEAPGDELRLVFSLSADSFNPYHQMRLAKKKVTSTAIYMVCLNLPSHLRYLSENMYLVGVVPGPTKPSADQINHFLALLVDELTDFWSPGVYYTRTALRPHGRRARTAMVPLVADTLAARQLAGFGPYNKAHVLCTVCKISDYGVESTDYSRFVPRDEDEHRAAAVAWRDASSDAERKAIFDRTGIRWSELLRLEYWNPCAFIVIDTMHNLYLGLLQRHIRGFWGINDDPDFTEGDTSTLEDAPAPDRPSDSAMQAGEKAILYGSRKALMRLKRPILYHLCTDRGLRFAGFNPHLVENLEEWRKKEGLPMPRPEALSIPMPDYGDRLTPKITEAETSLRKGNKATTLTGFTKEILIAMCNIRKLDAHGTKPVLAARLVQYREQYLAQQEDAATEAVDQDDELHNHDDVQGADESDEDLFGAETDEEEEEEEVVLATRHGGEAIGRETLNAYIEDRKRMEVPSWVNPPPLAFGTTQHGKLSADQWRTLCTISLPITLIRTWGFQEPRRVDMLRNFLDLVEAVELVGLMEIDEERIVRAEILMEKYLNAVKELYKGQKIQPNHHLALHLGVFLRLFGPVHSWRAFVFERFNYFLQMLNTNMRFGELEMTFMMRSCREANFRPILRTPAVRSHMKAFSESLWALDKDDRCGMRFDAILRSTGTDDSHEETSDSKATVQKKTMLSGDVFAALVTRLNADEPGKYTTDNAGISGVHFKPRTRSSGDSNLIFRHPALKGSHPGRIEEIFRHSRGSGNTLSSETFLVVRRLASLDDEDIKLDPYRTYPPIGGCLYYDTYMDEKFVLRATDVVSHFAKTTMDHLVVYRPRPDSDDSLEPVRFARPCAHVRPLDRLLRDAGTMDLVTAGTGEDDD